MQDVAHAIAQQELEGLKVPQATVNDLLRVAHGEIDTEEALRTVKKSVEEWPSTRTMTITSTRKQVS